MSNTISKSSAFAPHFLFLRGWGTLILAILLFSSVEVATKMAGTGWTPFWLASVRFILAALLLTPFLWRRLWIFCHSLSLRDAGQLVWLSFIGVTLAIGCFHLAIPRLQANVSAILFSMNPAVVLFLSPLFAREPFQPRLWWGILFGLTGTGIFLLESPLQGLADPVGVMWISLSLLFFAVYTLASRDMMQKWGADVLLCMMFWVGGFLFVPLAFVLEGPPTRTLLDFSWAGMVWLVGFATVGGYVAYFRGISVVGATRGSQMFFLKPFFAVLYAWIFLSEMITWQVLCGGLFALAAMVVAFWPANRKRTESPPQPK